MGTFDTLQIAMEVKYNLIFEISDHNYLLSNVHGSQGAHDSLQTASEVKPDHSNLHFICDQSATAIYLKYRWFTKFSQKRKWPYPPNSFSSNWNLGAIDFAVSIAPLVITILLSHEIIIV